MVPGGNVSGARNRRRLTRLSEWDWIRQAKAVPTLVLIPDKERGSGFHPIPCIGLAAPGGLQPRV